MKKELYFDMVDRKAELDKQLDKLHAEYMGMVWDEKSTKELIMAKLKVSDQCIAERNGLIQTMAQTRKSETKETMMAWRKEYYERKAETI